MKRFIFTCGVLFLFSVPLILWGCEEAACPHNRTTDTPIAPTCDEEGYTLRDCLDCDFEYKTDIKPPLGHTMNKTVTAPTCTTEGFTTYTCDCGYTYTADRIPPTGHLNEAITVTPTCTESGYTTLTCIVCAHTEKTDFQSALGHSFTDTVQAATCTDIGYTTSTCSVCSFSYRKNYIDPTGHDFTKTVTHPTRTAPGAFIHTCECGYKRQDPLFYSDVFTGAFEKNTEILAKGVDVSRYQHTPDGNGYLPLDWQAVKAAGFEFAILKAGSTASGLEPTFEMDYADAKAAGLSLGAYFYTYSSTPESIRQEAELLLTWLNGKQFEYPIYFDLEDPSLADLSKDTLTELCVTFISILQENGYYAALYSNNDWLINRLHKDTLQAAYDVWYARYPLTGSSLISPDDPFTWNGDTYGAQLGMWQYTDHGVIEGIDDIQFDFNYAYRDYPSIIKKYGYNGFSVS